MRALAAALVLGIALPAAAQEPAEVTPLFRDDAPLDITLSGPIDRIASRAERSTEAYPAVLEAAGETLAIELSARGTTRRDHAICRFPPLRVEIPGNPGETSLFDHQRRLKLVTHCDQPDRYEQRLLREYAAYLLYNQLAPESFRVRLLRVTYRDEGGDSLTRWGFFIEDIDDAARRVGRREIATERVDPAALDPRAAARFFLFQYMIGNTDWAVVRGEPGEDCCHNVRMLGEDEADRGELVPVPYDFDFSGLVDSPDAVPHPILPIGSVRQRYYRGFCTFNEAVVAEVGSFRDARPRLEAALTGIPGLSSASLRDMQRYIDGFYEDIATRQSIERNLLRNCRQRGQG